jgi:hypothetical protein
MASWQNDNLTKWQAYKHPVEKSGILKSGELTKWQVD